MDFAWGRGGCKCQVSPASLETPSNAPWVLCERDVPCDELPGCISAGYYCWVLS